MIPDDFPSFVYDVSRLSKLFWREFALTFQVEALFDSGSRLPGFPSFTAEIFHRLYYDPEPEKLEASPPESAWAEKLHDEFAEIVGFDNLVRQCCCNQLAAGVATMEFCFEILSRLPQPRQHLQDPQKLRDFLKRLKTSTQPPAQILPQVPNLTNQEQQYLGDLIEDAGDDTENLIEQLRIEGKLAVQDAQHYAESLDESGMRQVLRAALAQTAQKLEEAGEWLAMMGLGWGTGEGTDQTVSPAERLQLAQQISQHEKLQHIAKLAGRLKDIADRKRRMKADDAFVQLGTIELGNNLARLLPSELQKLAEPDLFPLFAKGYYDQSLLQYKIVGKEKKALGPIIVCLDSSKSMGGLPDTWAKAATAVLLQIAHRDNRHFRVIHFDTKVRRIDDFPPKHHDYQTLLKSLLSFYSGGGTNWEPALSEAMRCIDSDTSLRKADVVMITDGLCQVSDEFLNKLAEQKQQRECSVLSILIGNRSERALAKFSDRVWSIRELNTEADSQIQELFLL